MSAARDLLRAGTSRCFELPQSLLDSCFLSALPSRAPGELMTVFRRELCGFCQNALDILGGETVA
jgi:hypothetical protein